MEVIRLRVKEVDFAQGEILIRDGKGAKDRVTMLPEGVSADLREHLQRRKLVFEDDLRAGKASVYLPDALARKYPAASTSWLWQYVFVAGSYSVDPRSGVERRHHLDEKLLRLLQTKDYGRYASNGKLPVAFTASNHTTGGNSGSPALNADGNLIGLNFDRVWEGTMSDINYDPTICRNIMVDIRYVLFIVDKYAEAKNIIAELKLVSKGKPVK